MISDYFLQGMKPSEWQNLLEQKNILFQVPCLTMKHGVVECKSDRMRELQHLNNKDHLIMKYLSLVS